MTATQQLLIGFHNRSSAPDLRWFGLRVTHRALFDALQTEWLFPSDSANVHLLLRSLFPPLREGVVDGESRYPIEIGLRLDPSRLPDLQVFLHREGAPWSKCRALEIPDEATVVAWPGPIPLSAVLDAWVSTAEEQTRLIGMARQVSNVPLMPVHVEHLKRWGQNAPPVPEGVDLVGLTFPDNYDAVRGAVAMGFWALPRTDPWFDLLAASFARAKGGLSRSARGLDAPWLTNLPWRPSQATSRTFDELLWSVALQVFGVWTGGRAQDLCDCLRDAVLAAGGSKDDVQKWHEATRAILRADTAIVIGAAFENPIGTALQLVLTRNDPDRFKTWAIDQKGIPPAVWWSGAILCGLLRGYRRLPAAFRGEESRRRYIAIQQLKSVHVRSQPLRWERIHEATCFLAGNSIVAEMHETARTAWFRADYADPAVKDAARNEATRLRWPCISRELRLPPGKFDIQSGGLSVRDQKLTVRGDVRILVPDDVTVLESVDVGAFCKCLATRGGELGGGPPHAVVYRHRAHRVEPNVSEIPGLIMTRSFLSEAEESSLLKRIESSPWLTVLKRRVQHYGWRYDYKARQIARDMHIGPLPEWASCIARRLAAEGLLPWEADQVIVNEYTAGQGIGKHVDCVPCFEGAVAMISLLESWNMRFSHPSTGETVDQLLERGSVAVMTGESRYVWTHEIPRRKTEPSGLVRTRRISLTFRKVRGADSRSNASEQTDIGGRPSNPLRTNG